MQKEELVVVLIKHIFFLHTFRHFPVVGLFVGHVQHSSHLDILPFLFRSISKWEKKPTKQYQIFSDLSEESFVPCTSGVTQYLLSPEEGQDAACTSVPCSARAFTRSHTAVSAEGGANSLLFMGVVKKELEFSSWKTTIFLIHQFAKQQMTYDPGQSAVQLYDFVIDNFLT